MDTVHAVCARHLYASVIISWMLYVPLDRSKYSEVVAVFAVGAVLTHLRITICVQDISTTIHRSNFKKLTARRPSSDTIPVIYRSGNMTSRFNKGRRAVQKKNGVK